MARTRIRSFNPRAPLAVLSVLVLFAAGVPADSGETGTLPDQYVWSTQEPVGEWVNPVDSALSPDEETLYHLAASPGDDGALHLAAVRVSDGQHLWRMRWANDTSRPLAMALEVHPQTGVIFVAGAARGETGRPHYTAHRPMVWAFNATGHLLWSTRILDRDSEGGTSGRDLALDLGTGRLVVAVYGAKSGNVVALDASTGEEVWRACPQSRCAQTSELHVWPEQNSIFAVGGRHGYGSTRWAIFVHSIDLQTGEIRWMRSFDDSPGRHIGADEKDGILYALSGLGRLYALQPDTGNLLWAATPPLDFHELRSNSDLVVDDGRNRAHVVGGEKDPDRSEYHGRIWTYAGDGTLLRTLRHSEPAASSVSFRSAILSEDEGRLYTNLDKYTNGIVNGHATLVVDRGTGRLLGGGHHEMYARYYGIEYSERANLILRTGAYGQNGPRALGHAAYASQLPPNAPPVPQIEGPGVANLNERFTFTGAASSDPDGALAQWTWDSPNGLVLDETQVDVTLSTVGEECLRLQLLDDLYADAVTEHCVAVSDRLNVTAELPRESYAALEHADLHVVVNGARDQGIEGADVTVRIELRSRSGGTPGLTVYNIGRHSGCINWEHTTRTGEDGTLVVRIPPVGERCAFVPWGVGSATMLESDLYYAVDVEARWLGANTGTAATEYDVHV